MGNFTTVFSRWAHKVILPGLAVFLTFGLIMYSPKPVQAQQGVAPTEVPAGGFAIDGNLLSRTPTTPPFSSDNGDFLPNEGAAGSGGYVFTLAGVPVDTIEAYHIIDGYDAADSSIFTGGSKFNNDPNTWMWKLGKPPGKDDIDNAMFFFSSDSLGNIWFIGSGDRKKTNGNTYLDFELLQNPLNKNTDGTFISLGIDGGRTIGDLVISITYTNGGTDPQLFIYQWDSTAPGEFGYTMINPAAGTSFLATNSDSAVVVPYGAFGSDTYQVSAFTEIACNLNDLISGSYSCVDIKTVIIKTKASQSINAVLKDFIIPVQVDISSAPVVSVNSETICFGDSATLTATVLSGTGPYTYLWSTGDTTQSITVSPDTTTQYTIVVTGINGCPSSPEISTVTVIPLPVCFISGLDTICPLGTEQYYGPDSLNSYAWAIIGAATIVGDTSAQMIEVEGNGTCDSSFTLSLVVTNVGGCTSTCSMTVYMMDTLSPVITDVPDSLFLQCASGVPVASPDSITVTDNCVGSLVLTVTDSITNDTVCPNQFTLTRTWTATDTCGNIATAIQIITVFDSIPPVLYGVPADTGICCADSIPPPANVTALDSCDGSVPVVLTEIVSDSTSPFFFTLTRTWTASDTCSNTVSDSQVIIVNDTLYGSGNFVNINSPGDIVKYLNVTPNPFVSSTNIQFSLYQDAHVSVDLYNFTGVRLKSLYNGNVSAGTNIALRLSPDASMGTGMYLLVLRTNHGIESRRIILTR